jgi:DNA-binding PadR family transcriptional regulator
MTGYGLSGFFMKKFGFIVNPSMVYSNLSAMERKGWIRCVRNGAGRAYSLTEKGKEITDGMNGISEEIQLFTKTMLKT